MKFSTREDIEAPIDEVFASLTDFAYFERQAMRRGIEVTRDNPAPGEGAAWSVRAPFRGKTRDIVLDVTRLVKPENLLVHSKSSGMSCDFEVKLMSLSRQRTRMIVSADIRPQTFAARVVIQSLKLAKATLSRRFETRVAGLARRIEDRFATP